MYVERDVGLGLRARPRYGGCGRLPTLKCDEAGTKLACGVGIGDGSLEDSETGRRDR